MNSPKASGPSKYKNLKLKTTQSPKELKEMLRKDYKNKVQNCRGLLLDKLRGASIEKELCLTLTEIYKNMFDFSSVDINNEEIDLLEELKKELIQEELEWWIAEYEKSQSEGIDWSTLEHEENIICLLCQKQNFTIENNFVSCSHCNIVLKTTQTVTEIKDSIASILDNHNSSCNKDPQFTFIPELNASHIYLICDSCNEMKLII